MLSFGITSQVEVGNYVFGTDIPDGTRIAYVVRTTNFKNNGYENKCYIHNIVSDNNYQLTRKGSVSQIKWLNESDLLVLKTEFVLFFTPLFPAAWLQDRY